MLIRNPAEATYVRLLPQQAIEFQESGRRTPTQALQLLLNTVYIAAASLSQTAGQESRLQVAVFRVLTDAFYLIHTIYIDAVLRTSTYTLP